jgi:hypothetical protein
MGCQHLALASGPTVLESAARNAWSNAAQVLDIMPGHLLVLHPVAQPSSFRDDGR